jgi:hypothetical protein
MTPLQESITNKVTFAFTIFVLAFVWTNAHWSVAICLTLYCFDGYIDKIYEKAKEWAGIK